jgi:hypothetical protein
MMRVVTTITQRVLLPQSRPSPVTPADIAAALGPDFLPWADLALLLVTHAGTLKQHGYLPAVDGNASSSTGSSTGSSSGSSSAGSNRARSSGRRSSRFAAAATAAALSGGSSSAGHQYMNLLQDGFPAWQVAQRQWEHVPASHKQLLGLFGVSPQAAVWCAAIMAQLSHSGLELPTPEECLMWNAHHLAGLPPLTSTVGVDRTDPQVLRVQAASEALKLQVQYWSNQPVAELLMPLLLYGAAHATADDGSSVWAQQCQDTATAVHEMMQERGRKAAAAAAAAASSSSSTESSAEAFHAATLSAVVRDEMLLLTLNLLQRLQQPKPVPSSSSSSRSSAAAPAANPSAPAARAERDLMHLLLLVTAGSAQEAAGVAGAERLSLVWQQQAGAIFTVLEAYVRSSSNSSQGSLPAEARAVVGVFLGMCSTTFEREQPQPLLDALARGGSEQQLSFFRLLVSVLKLAGSGATADGLPSLLTASNRLHAMVAAAASYMARADINPDVVDSSSGSSMPLWLLLAGRCFSHWAAVLQQVELLHTLQGGSWVQVIEQEQGQDTQDALDESLLDISIGAWVFAGPCAGLKVIAGDWLEVLGTDSSVRAGLSAAGYDLGPIVKSLKSLAACYPEVVQTQDVTGAVVAERVDVLIKVLVSLGQALSVFAVRHCCNNPSCVNTSGLTEKAIVCGKSCSCSGCKVARFCGKPCQVAHWKMHKPVCKMLAAAAAAAAGKS